MSFGKNRHFRARRGQRPPRFDRETTGRRIYSLSAKRGRGAFPANRPSVRNGHAISIKVSLPFSPPRTSPSLPSFSDGTFRSVTRRKLRHSLARAAFAAVRRAKSAFNGEICIHRSGRARKTHWLSSATIKRPVIEIVAHGNKKRHSDSKERVCVIQRTENISLCYLVTCLHALGKSSICYKKLKGYLDSAAARRKIIINFYIEIRYTTKRTEKSLWLCLIFKQTVKLERF